MKMDMRKGLLRPHLSYINGEICRNFFRLVSNVNLGPIRNRSNLHQTYSKSKLKDKYADNDSSFHLHQLFSLFTHLFTVVSLDIFYSGLK